MGLQRCSFIFLVLLLEYFGLIACQSCPNGSIQLLDEQKCIYPSIPLIYAEATAQCQSLSGSLVKIQNALENSFLYGHGFEFFNGDSQYIGVRRDANGTWVYEDGSPLTYRNWGPGEPSNTSNCAVLASQTTQWRSADCILARPFFCAVDIKRGCPTDWTYVSVTDSCYYFQNTTHFVDGSNFTTYNFTDAEMACQSLNARAHLVSIHSKDEDDVLIATQRRFGKPLVCQAWYTWIGLHGNALVGSMQWTDGTSLDYISNQLDCNVGGYFFYAISSCGSSEWACTLNKDTIYSRFICKMPST
ncbi:unnamed protein product, partial [Mesorhabditis belari]|uniref:C-type lectin domain-containing protein n=1 Tax=Mesorhabditis belari TaxID=2138241 RepID=A0AAF3J8E6_9BILA